MSAHDPEPDAFSDDNFRKELRRVEVQVKTAIDEVLKRYSTHQKIGLDLAELTRLTISELMANRKDWDRSEPFANWATTAATKFAKKTVLAKLLEENSHAAAQAVAKYFPPNRKGREQDDD